MLDLVLGWGCLSVTAIIYIVGKFVDDIRFHRHHKHKMTKN